MLFEHNRQPGANPVTHQRQKVFEYIEQMVTARYRADELDNHEEKTPDPTRDGFKITTQDLTAQACGVCGRCVVPDTAEGEQHGAETAKGAEAVVAG